MKKRSSKKTVTKTAKRPAADTKREPLAPITGGLGPVPLRTSDKQTSDRDLEAEAIVFRPDGGDRRDGMPLVGQFLGIGLSWDRGDQPEEIALATLSHMADELTTLSDAIGSLDDGNSYRYSNMASAMAHRAEMVVRLCERVTRARSTDTARVAPPPYEVACALLTLPGVLSGTSTRDRLLRIAERLDIFVATIDSSREWMEKVMSLPSRFDRTLEEQRETIVALHGHRRASETHRATVAVFPFEKDQDRELARRIAYAVGVRERYPFSPNGSEQWKWAGEIAAYLIDDGAKKKASEGEAA